MMRAAVLTIVLAGMLTAAVTAGASGLPPVAWGESAREIIETPYLCRGPLPVTAGVDVHQCNQSILGREALVSLYFVDGAYACFSVTMTPSTDSVDQAHDEFDAVVRDLEAVIGPSSSRETRSAQPTVTWSAERQTIRAGVATSDANALIGIVGFADEHRHRVAVLVDW
jgi:hypothetical protein